MNSDELRHRVSLHEEQSLLLAKVFVTDVPGTTRWIAAMRTMADRLEKAVAEWDTDDDETLVPTVRNALECISRLCESVEMTVRAAGLGPRSLLPEHIQTSVAKSCADAYWMLIRASAAIDKALERRDRDKEKRAPIAARADRVYLWATQERRRVRSQRIDLSDVMDDPENSPFFSKLDDIDGCINQALEYIKTEPADRSVMQKSVSEAIDRKMKQIDRLWREAMCARPAIVARARERARRSDDCM